MKTTLLAGVPRVNSPEEIHWYFWQDRHRKLLAKVKSFTDLALVCQAIIESAGGSLHILSGPMTSGGIGNGNKKINFKVIKRATEFMWTERGLRILSHLPFEDKLDELVSHWRVTTGSSEYCWILMEEFYGRILTPSNFAGMHFLDDWRSSKGATYERKCCEDRVIPIHDLGVDFSKMILALLQKEEISLAE